MKASGTVPCRSLWSRQSSYRSRWRSFTERQRRPVIRSSAWARYNRYRSSAELTFATSRAGSLTIEAELATDPLLKDEFSLGVQAVDVLFAVATAVERGNIDSIRLPRQDRDYLVRSVTALMPNEGDQYTVQLVNCRADRHPSVTFSPATRARVKEYLSATVDDAYAADEVVVVGELIKIYVDAGEDKITLQPSSAISTASMAMPCAIRLRT